MLATAIAGTGIHQLLQQRSGGGGGGGSRRIEQRTAEVQRCTSTAPFPVFLCAIHAKIPVDSASRSSIRAATI